METVQTPALLKCTTERVQDCWGELLSLGIQGKPSVTTSVKKLSRSKIAIMNYWQMKSFNESVLPFF